MAKEDEKLDIEDIQVPEELDIEDAVEEETNLEAPEEIEEPKETQAPTVATEKTEKKSPSKRKFFGEKKEKKEKKVSEINPEPEKAPQVVKESGGRSNFLKTFTLIALTILLTATVVLGAGWWWLSRKAPGVQEQRTETVKETPKETKKTENRYVNVAEGLNLRKEPDPKAEVLVIMPFGTKLEVLETQGDWIKTTYKEKTGWCMLTYTTEINPLVYKNPTYGFSITFPETWSSYKLFPISDPENAKAAYFVGLKTSDASYNETGVDKGYVSLFAISVFTKAQWAEAADSEGPKPTLLTQNDQYIISYSLPNGTRPTDIEARVDEVKSVLATTKFE